MRQGARLWQPSPSLLAHTHLPLGIPPPHAAAWSPTLPGPLQLFPARGHLSSSPKLLLSPEALGSWWLPASATPGLASDSGARFLIPESHLETQPDSSGPEDAWALAPTNKAFPTEQRQLTGEQTRSKKESRQVERTGSIWAPLLTGGGRRRAPQPPRGAGCYLAWFLAWPLHQHP